MRELKEFFGELRTYGPGIILDGVLAALTIIIAGTAIATGRVLVTRLVAKLATTQKNS